MRLAPAGSRGRRGLSLVEVMVVIAMLLVLFAVLVPSLGAILGLEHRKSALRLTMLYQQLHDEAILRNVTFRVAFNLDNNTFDVQVGQGSALVFTDPESKEKFDEDTKRRVALMDEKELAEYNANQQPFEKLGAQFQTAFELPNGQFLGGVYTPQYARMVQRGEKRETGADDEPLIVYTYVFPSGISEHTVIWLVDRTGADGFTIEVEPLSGNVKMTGELLAWDQAIDWIPDEGPDLP
ncbi:MAG: prepilin-type N-terminal cleavage/methylation domain-containing protein [Deltaproteobacteria bacterium]|nr:prepilin-type N-terminal cleavage/methylation domain-containing protein [Deltaproteobacteria bacterium]